MAALGSILLEGAKTEALSWTSADRIVLGGMLLVAVPVTAGLFPSLALALVPTTSLAVVCLWLWSRRVSSPGLVPCSLFGGGLVGYLNCVLAMLLCLVLQGDFATLIVGCLVSLFVGIFGAIYGLAYGLAFLPLLLVARSLRGLQRAEAFDRTLVGTGLWGLVLLASAAPVVDRLALDQIFELSLPLPFPNAPWVLACVSLLTLLVVGVERLRARRRWLQRVRQGQVPGWFVTAPEQFDTQLEELPEFCPRVLGRARPAKLVLAEGETHVGTYRTGPPVPRFRVG